MADNEATTQPQGRFAIADDGFRVDGRPLRLVSGAVHYFRVVPEYWRDRLAKLRAFGANCVETYVAWNLHEPRPGDVRFNGITDIQRFVQIAADLGLWVIVRPGPYICAEWEFGGLPAWLLADRNTRLRCHDERYLAAVDAFYDALVPRLTPLQIDRGGPIIMMQVENEYGSYGRDRRYLEHLEQALVRRGVTVPLFTSDGPTHRMLQNGTLPHVFKTGNFGSQGRGQLAFLRRYQPTGPLMNMEFWNGWFDHWGEPHHTRAATDAAAAFDEVLSVPGSSVNLYMFHGGTNFGFWNGANHADRYQPTVNSYDYDAPLSEAGDYTPKFFALRQVLVQHGLAQPPATARATPGTPAAAGAGSGVGTGAAALPTGAWPTDPPETPKTAYPTVVADQRCRLFDVVDRLATAVRYPVPLTMEELGSSLGFVWYRTLLNRPPRDEAPPAPMTVRVVQPHDRALVYLDGGYIATLERDGQTCFALTVAPGIGAAQLDIVVENLGRINFGPYLHDRKGITEGVYIDNSVVQDWTMYALPLDNLSGLTFAPLSSAPAASPAHSAALPPAPATTDASGPTGTAGAGTEAPPVEAQLPTQQSPWFFRAGLHIDTTGAGSAADSFLQVTNGRKGVIWVNGFCLSRYWQRGPQRTAYLPGPLLHQGENEIVILELHANADGTLDGRAPRIAFFDQPQLG